MIVPAWWTPTDTDIAAAYLDWHQGRRADLDTRIGRCRQCDTWQSTDGATGVCQMPATPATVNCGETVAENGCEQWYPRPTPAN